MNLYKIKWVWNNKLKRSTKNINQAGAYTMKSFEKVNLIELSSSEHYLILSNGFFYRSEDNATYYYYDLIIKRQNCSQLTYKAIDIISDNIKKIRNEKLKELLHV